MYVDEEVTAVVEVIKLREDKPIIKLKTSLYKRDNSIAIEGSAIVLYRGQNV